MESGRLETKPGCEYNAMPALPQHCTTAGVPQGAPPVSKLLMRKQNTFPSRLDCVDSERKPCSLVNKVPSVYVCVFVSVCESVGACELLKNLPVATRRAG